MGGVIIDDYPTLSFDNFPYGGVKRSGFGREVCTLCDGRHDRAKDFGDPGSALTHGNLLPIGNR